MPGGWGDGGLSGQHNDLPAAGTRRSTGTNPPGTDHEEWASRGRLPENITLHVRDYAKVLAVAIGEGPLKVRFRDGLREPLGSCLSAIAVVLRAWDDRNVGIEVFDEAAKRLSSLTDAVAATPRSDSASLAPDATVDLDVKRILTALRRRLLPEGGDGEAVESRKCSIPACQRRANANER